MDEDSKSVRDNSDYVSTATSPKDVVDSSLKNSTTSRYDDDARTEPVAPSGNTIRRESGPKRLSSDVLTYTPIDDAPPPAYSNTYGRVDIVQDDLSTVANVSNDGRVDIHIDQRSRRLSNLLVPALRSQLNLAQADQELTQPSGHRSSIPSNLSGEIPTPSFNIVIHVVGSRGDVQPFIALGRVLKNTYGHRVRLATHSTFRKFVEENGLEFFSIGGDPAELMAYMVRNPGLMPGKDALRSGEISRRRKGMYEIVQGCWRSCFEAGDGTGPAVSDQSLALGIGFEDGASPTSDSSLKPFIADIIIANPPSFAHIHCAEKLGIPLHLMFTMPWSPTQSFPHPLANIQASNADPSITNFISYALVEMMTWQGLGDIVNRFREKSLGLEPVNLLWAPGIASRLRIPFTYCWSPALIPKPKDWGQHISISGFYFLDLAGQYTPPADLDAFLNADSPPIYIGFGSIVVDDPNEMTELIFQAVRMTGRRALVSKGWGGLGADNLNVPEGIFMLGNVPHDWLFKRVCCVVHHGGAGTTAAGVALGKPTVIVPFFGDQPFWGAMIATAGAGPNPIPIKQLTSATLAERILEALQPQTLQRAQELGSRIANENGSRVGASNFHDTLGVINLRCALAPGRSAVWRVRRTNLRLSALAATVLGKMGLVELNDLKLYRPREYDTEDGPWDPITGGASALLGTIGSLMMGVADFPLEIFRALQHKAVSKQSNATSIQSTASVNSGTADPTGSASRSSVLRDPAELSKSSSMLRLPQSPSGKSSTIAPSEHPLPSIDPTQVTSYSSVSQNSTKSLVDLPRHMSFEAAIGTGKGVGRIVGAGLKSPMDFTLGLAKGFHNAPRLYGDESVRPVEKITGLQSGLKAASKEFGYGFYDGISGLVTQPLEGARKDGVPGLLKGLGKGIGGVILKPGAAIWGVPGYTFKGVYKELQKHMGTSVQNYIIAARTAQGLQEWQASTEVERQDIISRWHAIQPELILQKKLQFRGPQSSLRSRQSRPARLAQQFPHIVSEGGTMSQVDQPNIATQAAHDNAYFDNSNMEKAVRFSVAATSQDHVEEDELIERAIRASVNELGKAPSEISNDETMQKAIKASVAEANQTEHYEYSYQQQLEEALRQSLRENMGIK